MLVPLPSPHYHPLPRFRAGDAVFTPNLVVVLNGPRRRSDGALQLHRLEAGAELARASGHPLLIVGDVNGGDDIAALRAHALSLGVAQAFTAYHPHGRSLSDIWAAIAFLQRLPEIHEVLARVTTVRVVTDGWHMERAHTMFEGELGAMLGLDHGYTLLTHAVDGGEPPTPEMVENERRGLAAYRAGTYNLVPPEQAVGKPQPFYGEIEHTDDPLRAVTFG